MTKRSVQVKLEIPKKDHQRLAIMLICYAWKEGNRVTKNIINIQIKAVYCHPQNAFPTHWTERSYEDAPKYIRTKAVKLYKSWKW